MIRYLIIQLIALDCVASIQASEIKYAQNFSIENHASHRIVTIRNTWIGSGERTQEYALVPKSTATLPELPSNAIVVRTPVNRLVIMATVFLGPIRDLELFDSLVGIAYLDYANDTMAHQRVAEGLAKEVQSGTAMDVEALLLIQPDLVLTSTTGNPTFDIHPHMLRAGLPVVVTAGYMENHPLARTEWIKFLAAFYGEEVEERATHVFEAVEARYLELASLAEKVESRPTVLINAPYGGVWHVSGGRSYSAQALKDAGADYLFSYLDSSGGVQLDFEVILERASEADFWLNPSSHESIKAMLSSDERFAGFKPIRNGNVFNKNRRVNEHGGNDIYERGVSHPEEVLADLVKIFHPELMVNHEFVFYDQLK